MIRDYRILKARTHAALEQAVCASIAQGWQPLGAPFVETRYYEYVSPSTEWCQAVTRGEYDVTQT
jgi:hypothetical protein